MQKTWLMGLVLTSIVAASANAQDDVSFKTNEIAKGLYVISGVGGFAGGNILVSTGEDGTVMIDDSIPPLLGKLRQTVEKIADSDIEFLINTHLHGDHTGNNLSFAKTGTHIIGHENVRKRMAADEEKDPQALPVLTFSEEVSFYLNHQQAQVIHVARAHTDGDAIIYFPEANVLHTGDVLFNGMFPFIDLDNGGSVQGYLDAQMKVLELADEQTIIVPGHGPLARKADVLSAHEMLIDARKRVAAMIMDGKKEEQIVAANPLEVYHDDWNWDFITTEKMTRQLHRDLHMHGDGSHAHGHHHH
ncbi:MBL fold metallo-hydrolase [Gilvimarinus sp. DA14]|uniref:MBL fold metallo-hydrolase n=1 Tax=Gilvimarinus sp. DA14 TaxID=2956798 RepID=UPI0020B71824|nr:MBL fold metallo-hydrolase [Gilvimarinus sp. DA14]UTF60053.1 MBL fold metallo-hydrolase [Gilvimarinus sp. DA14]